MIRFATLLFFIFLTSDLFPNNFYHEEGRKYYINKNYEQAKENFKQSTEDNDDGDSYYFLGEIEKIAQNYKEAENFFEIAIRKETSEKYLKNAYWNLIVLKEQSKDFPNLIKVCREMWLTLKSDTAKKKAEKIINRFLWSDNQKAIEAYQQTAFLEKTEEVFTKLKEAIFFDSKFLAPKIDLGLIAYKKKDYETAVQYFSEIVYEVPFYAEAHLLLGDIYLKKRFYSLANEHFHRAWSYGFLESNLVYELKFKISTCFYNQQNYLKAQENLQEAITIKGETFESLVLLSSIYSKEGNFQEALNSLDKANSLKEGSPLILFKKGSIYYQLGDDLFISYFKDLFEITKNNEAVRSDQYLQAFTLLIKPFFKSKNYEQVLEIFSFLPNSFLDYEKILILGKANYYQGNYLSAINYFEQISLNKEDKWLLCLAYLKNGRTDLVQKVLLELSNLYNEDDFLSLIEKEDGLKKNWQDLKTDQKILEENLDNQPNFSPAKDLIEL